MAQIQSPDIAFFVEFPAWLTYVAGVAALLTIPTLALSYFSITRRLGVGRSSLVLTGLVLILTAVTVAVLGPSDVLTIINPNW